MVDARTLAVSGSVCLDSMDIGCSDHFLVWTELGRIIKNRRIAKHAIRKWRLDRFEIEEVKERYQDALKAELHEFSESIRNKVKSGMKGHELVNTVLLEWEHIVNRVAKSEIGEKFIVCGRSISWWDNEVKDKISLRRELHKRMVDRKEDLWEEYCRVRKEVKRSVRAKKINAWKEVVEKVNRDFEGCRKQFWSFVGRKTKGRKGNIASLQSESGVSVSSVRDKLEVLQKHYQKI